MPDAQTVSRAMTIAGSDSGAGAGIQADLKTFAALGVYGTSAVTAVTAQNTLGVTDVHELPTSLIQSQIDAIISDIGVDAVKTGMLSSPEIIEAVAAKIREYDLTPLVVDPVMVAKGGDRLLQERAVDTLRDVLVPLAFVVTPNAPEAEVLTGRPISTVGDARAAAKALVEDLGAMSAVVKGGHLDGPATDVLYVDGGFTEFTQPRIDTKNTHGTGCTFASAVAAGLAKGLTVHEAVAQAKEYVTEAIRTTFPMGGGHGPLNHFHRFWER
ncbi:MAG: bifunctional hydroxymethylpyrimidine kinase/phosphomethylpyrimidine kinase [Chloroflexi bacterium]|jgi:hydroxymethylpyrimidine/phosphomethylpyrimidine kinase|nr:bifunctional hydroxymethylpyrimidine kinase/phosphomethylpyrimidine kinase [Chloroflexota bacterium]MDP6422178.1 bifunctional hydroxymethylpyrimidine kinase/phosphomethylpyrimidine kinase [SAR202 cluster bacterium]MDP6663469.1 bifunctional hydroxymethylpyrimidine kinase/phosphomethylpyrimidine kinase [SAR202 cluster bacterium]MQG58715.1 bifunctional hydroxymethylpyrimidine kinase/phosphomethylpyrimidine kinase [SAR202 cluster bacterium]|tara:strand:- start:1682 stop:2491 length:810 start_codon:yes stop_codon:yes gene_type:complete